MLKKYDNIKTKLKIERLQQLIKDFNVFIKQCYNIVWSVEKTDSKNARVANTKKEKTMLFSKCAVCESKNSTFFKEQEASKLLSSLEIMTPLSKIPLVGNILS